MEKSFARFFSVLFHPLMMTSIGMLIIFNSASSLAVIQFEVKRMTLIVIFLFTVIFPAFLVLMLYHTKTISSINLQNRSERIVPLSMTIIMYLFAFFVMRQIPQLSRGHMVFLFCPPAAIFLAMIINRYIKLSIHLLALGGVVALIFVLMFMFQSPIESYLIIAIMATGITASSRLKLEANTPAELLIGFVTGFFTTLILLTSFLS